jgi:hypothetical protein
LKFEDKLRRKGIFSLSCLALIMFLRKLLKWNHFSVFINFKWQSTKTKRALNSKLKPILIKRNIILCFAIASN